MKRLLTLLGCCIFAGGLIGCAVNPVTGKNQLSFVSPEQEVAIGAKNYEPSQQSQGGRYVVDPELTVYVNKVGKKLAAASDRPQLPSCMRLHDTGPHSKPRISSLVPACWQRV